MSKFNKDTRIAIIGGGLVGAMAACYMGKRGFQVDLYEYRDDIRLLEHVSGRSINLALSERGLQALRHIGMEKEVIKNYCVPMYGRMIHNTEGKMSPIFYSKKGEYIHSVSRRDINEALLSACEKLENVKIHFKHKLVSADLDTGKMKFSCTNNTEIQSERESDLIIGADGAYSAVRREIIKKPFIDYIQKYIDHGYVELVITPTSEGKFAMPANYLHVWPRDSFMLIALPNTDRSFTVTLFMEFNIFNKLTNPEDVILFFKKYFPDALELIGEASLIRDFFKVNPSYSMTVQCNPVHVGNRAILIGDAAHVMAPFYGQGMNAAFEDCLILDNLVDKYDGNFNAILPEFSTFRDPDNEAIFELAYRNYIEMRHLVNNRSFLLRLKLDAFLHSLFPKFWIPLYTMVTFSRMRYSQCFAQKEWQDKIVNRGATICLIATLGIGFWAAFRYQQYIKKPSSFNILKMGKLLRQLVLRKLH